MTHAFLIPDMAHQLLNTLHEQGVSSTPLDFKLSVAGGFISRKLAEQLIKRVTTHLINLYGSSETNVSVLEAKVTNLDDLHWPEQSDLNSLGHEFAQFDQVRFAIVYPFPRTRTGNSKIDRIALRKLVFPVQ